MIPVDRFNSNPVVPDVADEQPAVRRDRNAVRLAQRADGGAAVAGKSCSPVPATVDMSPVLASTRLTTWLSRSAMRWPVESN